MFNRRVFLLFISAVTIILSISAVAVTFYRSNEGDFDIKNLLVSGEKILEQAQEHYNNGALIDAILFIDENVDKHDNLASIRDSAVKELSEKHINEAYKVIKNYDYNSAYDILSSVSQYIPKDDTQFHNLLKTSEEFMGVEEYKGIVEHIFFHPLLAYPELAFDGDSLSRGFDDYFVTVSEFKEIMKRLYENDYILIDIRLTYRVNDDGSVERLYPMIPTGKKPMVLSIDDLNFYKYMRENGTSHGFAFNDDGDLVTYTDDGNGRTYSDDNEIVPILDRMINEHPDFSFGGHKGIIASTGYEGTLGFPTDDMDAGDYPQVLEEARKVANRLKETGWIFASHSYGHNSPAKKSLAYMERDTDKWLKEVSAVVGETDIYIYPFGELINFKDKKHLQMVEKGFKMFCGVQATPYVRFYDKWALMQRRNIDGIAFRYKRLDDMIDTSQILENDIRPYDYKD